MQVCLLCILCWQVLVKPHLSECLLEDLSLMKEVLLHLCVFTLSHTGNFEDMGNFQCLLYLHYFAGEVPVLNVSYKPQKISPKSTVSYYSVIWLLKESLCTHTHTPIALIFHCIKILLQISVFYQKWLKKELRHQSLIHFHITLARK